MASGETPRLTIVHGWNPDRGWCGISEGRTLCAVFDFLIGLYAFYSVCSSLLSIWGMVLALGNFDGVHRGHQAVVTQAVEEARRRGTRSGDISSASAAFSPGTLPLLSALADNYVVLKIWV